MSDLRTQLAALIGGTYRIERELGGGGMSRVFLAEETALGRRVVVKVLPPEMAADVNRDRFQREIQLAAKLQHPHIVPLLTAGAQADLLFYVMPYIEGESLRARLNREGELPIPEVVRILREVVDALAYAHRSGVVHRDIKPDNVLLSEGHAVVMDFGVAKAVSASSGASALTSLGLALGTPAYMAPEQAAADPHVDHRADLYAVGALAYEMLCGRPPFGGPTPQAVMAAHITEAPEPVTRYRATVSEALNELVMRCLAKKAADRWQSAGDLLPVLEAMTTPSGGAMPSVAHDALVARRSHPARVAGWFALAAAGVLGVVYLLVRALGLPNWVLYGAGALVAVGLPLVVLTGHHERRRAVARTAGTSGVAAAHGFERHFTWRKVLLGGALGFGALAVLTAAYAAMRVLGIGPAGTLLTSGALKSEDQIVVAELENRTSDSTLGPSITEALRIDLGQSPVVRLVDASAVSAALVRMQRAPGTPLDLPVAREVAEREGAKAIVSGEIAPLGSGYVLTARLMSAADGSTIIALRETANDASGIIAAVDRLSARLRERIGESLRTIRASEPLSRATTTSLEALRLYSRAMRAHRTGDLDRAIDLYEQAVTVDSTFATAYRGLGVALSNVGADESRVIAAATKAFELRDRLPPVERYLAEGNYYTVVEYAPATAADAYRSLLEIEPTHSAALNNLSILLYGQRRYAETEEVLRHAMASNDSTVWQHFTNLAQALFAQGRFAAAESVLIAFSRRQPGNPSAPMFRSMFAFARGDYTEARAYTDSLALAAGSSPVLGSRVTEMRVALDVVHGQFAAAEREANRQMVADEERGQTAQALDWALLPAWADLVYRNAPAAALRKVETAIRRYQLSRIPASDRPYAQLIGLYAVARRPDLARATKEAWERELPEALRRRPSRHEIDARMAEAEGTYDQAAASWRAFYEEMGCILCGLYELGRAYDLGGHADSAIAVYERALTVPDLERASRDAFLLAPTLKRLAELHEERNDVPQALEYYGRFVELWEDPDPEFQSMVADVRRRMQRLSSERT